ncbi:dolichol kinase sec59 [Achaetomium macrosporum]|uniref:dolichol kinase n=1 Tax=Achaetomium macrosporum TaxID=79813 RepID=A0AAN7CCF8_9PEZI|nr:dolichol kinase sec59 [Achaetomium macrosporum]
MPEHLQPPPVTVTTGPANHEDQDRLRILSRSPHPYHRLSSELLEPSDRLSRDTPYSSVASSIHSFPSFARESPFPTSESGTDADDENFLKGLPAPKARLHKGLRGRNEPLSGTSTPALSPAALEEEGRKTPHLGPSHGGYERDKRGAAERARRRREILRRVVEALLLGWQMGMVVSNSDVRRCLRIYEKELLTVAKIFFCLLAAYPLRLVAWAYRQGKPSKSIPIQIPATFDPAPLLYPPLVPVLVSLLVARNVEGGVLPSLVLSICALPRQLVPGARYWEYLSCTHWLLSCIPVTWGRFSSTTHLSRGDEVPREALVLLYPLHQTLCLVLHHLTTTSLLVSELQLLSVGLISLLLLARSPQAVVLKAVLWGGGLGLIVLCGQVIQQGISLARVPKWRFRRATPSGKRESGFPLLRGLSLLYPRHSGSGVSYNGALSDSDPSADACVDDSTLTPPTKVVQADAISDAEAVPTVLENAATVQSSLEPSQQSAPRRHTLPAPSTRVSRTKSTTPSGRRKRATSSSVRAFFSLTQTQAAIRKWLYACYVYLCILLIIFVGVRAYVQRYALFDHEPIGWALGYLLGDIPQFRFQVVKANLERWICLPPRPAESESCPSGGCGGGWVQHTRLTFLGQANTRLFLSAYWLGIIITGLAIVFRLSPVYEVDTRRKVFHFMMVAMFLPTVYIDPCYVALALALMLAIFLLLDLLRASQLPPLSKPIARFLTPYVDGRDLRGPVVISHIFLLIGCAIPLWLSLASLPRAAAAGDDDGPLKGWEVPTWEVSMVSGVVCVGLGDAAASLVGRRWGHRKWIWGGGKSVEGSLAFAVAVFAGLMSAAVWLRLGGWEVATTATGSQEFAFGRWPASGMDALMSVVDLGRLWPWLRAEAPKMALCASLASLTEAVLTGSNDNVVVPVVLWGCVKSLGV